MAEPDPRHAPRVIVANEQSVVDVDTQRWELLAAAVLVDERVGGELTLTFVDADEIAALNAEHMGQSGPTDVLSFPLDTPDSAAAAAAMSGDVSGSAGGGVPTLLGDVVVCPEVARDAAASHAGTLDDELALLVVHGVLHVLGHDHAHDDDTARMRVRELELLERHHWGGPAPAGFSQTHVE